MSKYDPTFLPWWIVKKIVGSKRGKRWLRQRMPGHWQAPLGEMPALEPFRERTPPRRRPPKTGAPGRPKKPPRPLDPLREPPKLPPLEWPRRDSPSPEGRKRRKVLDSNFSICKQSTIS